ncbi:hypothetical protein ABZ424_25380 [Streptomyces sp. NPDC005790]|uniref:hypothetical protein n=1 Tax=Streptomyces sp. NPDC005790 TaxID=3154777 RepID=UPI0033FD6EDD
MTACAIEDETTGIARTATAAGPTEGPAEPDEPAEPVEPPAVGLRGVGADAARADAARADAARADAARAGADHPAGAVTPDGQTGAGPAGGVGAAGAQAPDGQVGAGTAGDVGAAGAQAPEALAPSGPRDVSASADGPRGVPEVPRGPRSGPWSPGGLRGAVGAPGGFRLVSRKAGVSVPPRPSSPQAPVAAPPAPLVPPTPPAPSAPSGASPAAPPKPATAAVPAAPADSGEKTSLPPSPLVPPALTLAAGHAYAARLTPAGEAAGPGWFPERWTLDGPEPYAVLLPLDEPEDAGSDVLPLSDGRVLFRRQAAPSRHSFSLLYPTGPGTGEIPLGALDCAELTLLPPSPDGMGAYALLPGERSTGVWLVAGGAFGPEQVAEVPGRCSAGVWLDREGRLLAVDRQMPGGGPVKAVVVDLGRGGVVSPLLQIAPESNDRLLLADADSGLLLVRSDAPGQDRLGWGVLGSCLPVRFPECLRRPDETVTPFAVQPGQMLMPESCAVALRIDGAAGSWVGLWRPAGRRLHQVAAPGGWLAGAGFWTREGILHLPYAQEGAPCAVALMEAPADEPHTAVTHGTHASGTTPARGVCTPVPLGQAPLTGRTGPG